MFIIFQRTTCYRMIKVNTIVCSFSCNMITVVWPLNYAFNYSVWHSIKREQQMRTKKPLLGDCSFWLLFYLMQFYRLSCEVAICGYLKSYTGSNILLTFLFIIIRRRNVFLYAIKAIACRR